MADKKKKESKEKVADAVVETKDTTDQNTDSQKKEAVQKKVQYPYNGPEGRSLIIPSKKVRILNPEQLTYDEAKALCKKHWQLYRFFDF